MVYQDFTWKEFGKQNVTMHFNLINLEEIESIKHMECK